MDSIQQLHMKKLILYLVNFKLLFTRRRKPFDSVFWLHVLSSVQEWEFVSLCMPVSPRQCLESEDDLQQLQKDGVPSEVTDWLASTFTQRIRRPVRRSDEKPKFRSIVHAVQAGIFVERCNSTYNHFITCWDHKTLNAVIFRSRIYCHSVSISNNVSEQNWGVRYNYYK